MVDIAQTFQKDSCGLTAFCPGGILLATSVCSCLQGFLGAGVDVSTHYRVCSSQRPQGFLVLIPELPRVLGYSHVLGLLYK